MMIFHARRYEKGEVEAEFITVDGSKLVEPIGERQSEFLAAAVDVINRLENFWPLTVSPGPLQVVKRPAANAGHKGAKRTLAL